MMLLKISWLNIWRHPGRSLVIMCSVAVGLWAGLFSMGFYNGFSEERVQTSIADEISHIQIHNPKFPDDQNILYAIPNAASVLESIRSLPQVKIASARLVTRGMIASATGSAGAQVNGVVPMEEDSLTHLKKKIVQGTAFETTERNPIVVGEKMAQKLKVHLGSKVVLTMQDTSTAITAGAFRIVGIFRTTSTPYDERNVFVRRSDLWRMLNDSAAATEIAILLHSEKDVDSTTASLKRRFPHLLVQSWRELSPELNLIVTSTNLTMYIFMVIILLAMAFGIINTMLMAVLERIHEIGMLIALGMNRRRVFAMVLMETVLLVLAAAPVGLGIAWGTITYFGIHGIHLSAFETALRAYGYADVIHTSLATEHYVLVLLLVVATAIASSLFPARKALKLQPAEAMRE